MCRRLITTVFRIFPDREGTAEEREAAIAKIREYNNKFEDNRSIFRHLVEFPTVLKTIFPHILSLGFLLLFFRSTYFKRCMLLIFFYLLLPIDLIPEGALGMAGFVDDILVAFLVLMFGLTGYGVVYVRDRA